MRGSRWLTTRAARRPASPTAARVIGALAAVLGVLAAASWGAPAAAAPGQGAGRCDEVVVDDAHVLAQPDAVVAAAAHAGDTTGALVRVRVVASLDGHDAETHRRLIEEGCPSWMPGGHRDARLLLVMVAPTEHKTTVAYG